VKLKVNTNRQIPEMHAIKKETKSNHQRHRMDGCNVQMTFAMSNNEQQQTMRMGIH